MLIDKFDRQAATTDHDLDRDIKTCEEYAFDIERQISTNWSRFLFEYGMCKLKDLVSFSNGDPENAYGSWGIHVNEKSLIYDGRDDVLLARTDSADAFNYNATSLKDLTFKTFSEYLDYLKQDK